MKILLATDGSTGSHEAEWLLSRLSFNDPLDLTIATVVQVPHVGAMRRQYPSHVEELLEEYREHAKKLVATDAELFEGIDGTVRTEVLQGHAADELLGFAAQNGIELIVLGARGQSPTERFLLGSVSQRVATHAHCSVLVSRPTGLSANEERPLRIVVCHDGSEASEAAINHLVKISSDEHVEITVLGIVAVIPHYGMDVLQRAQPLWDEEKAHLEEALGWAVERLKTRTPHVHSELREATDAAAEITDSLSRISADLVVLGDHGRSRVQRFFLGSTSESVLRHADSSVWIVRSQS